MERTMNNSTELPDNPTHYLVSPQGWDSPECLTYTQSNVSCRTVTYILQNQCEEDQLLHIRLNGRDVHKEPCWKDVENKFTSNYTCYVNLFGDLENLSELKCEDNIALALEKSTNVFSLLLTFSPSTLQHCSISDTNINNETTCTRTKLRLSNLFLSDFQIHSVGEHIISVSSVKFSKSSIIVDAKSRSGCYFSCRNCTFINDGAAAITFRECSRANLAMHDSVIFSAQLNITFLFNIDFIPENVTVALSGQQTLVEIHAK